jgi:hypothetical protein
MRGTQQRNRGWVLNLQLAASGALSECQRMVGRQFTGLTFEVAADGLRPEV